jgi:hypothetical protein
MSNAIALPHPGRVGQATAIEQSRAVAEVYAAILVAQQCPRDVQAALRAMRESCTMQSLADRAFFRFPRAGSTVSGPSIYLARELARCWGNIQYGVAELRRDDDQGESEMQAFAWDVQTNSRAAAIFIVPHKRDKRGGPERLVDMRDIYENNANAGARRVRECIFGVLPLWFTEEAKDLCNKTLTDGGGKPLPQRVADAISTFEAIGVSEERIAEKLGRSSSKWTAVDVAQLGVTYKSIQRGEVTKDEEFPAAAVTAAEIVGAVGPRPVVSPVATEPSRITERQSKRLHAILTEGGINRETKLALLTHITRQDNPGRAEITSSSELTEAEAQTVITELDKLAKLKIPLIEAAIELIDRPADGAS